MADDLENKLQKNKEIKQGEKVAKTISSDKSVAAATPPTKTKELKKNTSNIANKEVKEIPQSTPENKKVTSTKKIETNKKLDDTKNDKKSKLSAKTDSSKDLKKDTTGNSKDIESGVN